MSDPDATSPHPGLGRRALAAFLLLPGTVGYAIPIAIGAGEGSANRLRIGLLLVATGSALLIWCVIEFYGAGGGTLAPWAPPQSLVVTGPYRWSRNPMYIAVVTLILGWALWFASFSVAVYLVGVAVAFHLRVAHYEEPRLAAQFGSSWRQYESRVRRWL